jgi:hypothetical protein
VGASCQRSAFSGQPAISYVTVTIVSGNVRYTQTVAPTSFSIDLFAAGFANQIRNGQPLSITFNVSDTLSADVSGYVPGARTNATETLLITDSRSIGSAFDTHLAVYYEVPEPLTTALAGADWC